MVGTIDAEVITSQGGLRLSLEMGLVNKKNRIVLLNVGNTNRTIAGILKKRKGGVM